MTASLTLPADNYTIRPLCGAIKCSHNKIHFCLIGKKLDIERYDEPIGEVRKDAHVVLHGMGREVSSF